MTRIYRRDIPEGLAHTQRKFLRDIAGMSDTEAYEYYKAHKGSFKYNTEETTQIFREMNACRCSFCTKFISDFDTEMTIEHIQLKHICPQKIFEWHNLLCSCRTCNTKRSKKPYDEQQYLDPTVIEDIATYFCFKLNGRIEINKELNAAQQEKAQYMIDLYGLNRDMLVCERRTFLSNLMSNENYYQFLAKQKIYSQFIIFWAAFAYYRRSKD